MRASIDGNMPLTGQRRLTLTTVAATVVLLAASGLAGKGDQVDPATGPGWMASGTAAPVTDRSIQIPVLPVGQARVRESKGTPRLPVSALGHLDIPVAALLAYQGAAAVMGQVDERCGLSWTLLAAIGRVESDHGRAGGAQLMPDGTSSEQIRGVALDGRGSLARIRDTDAGLLDGDVVWDRAVGPMQFLPSTWSVVGVDADGDAVRSPDDIEDAALAAAVLLCSAPGELDTAEGRRTAVFRYNPSDSYVASVLALERSYRAGEFDVPSVLGSASSVTVLAMGSYIPSPSVRPEPGGRGQTYSTPTADPAPDPLDQSPTPTPGATPDPTPGATPDPTPGATPDPTPGPTPDPTPGPTPDPTDPPDPPQPEPTTPEPPTPPEPGPVELTGVLTICGTEQGLWCVGDLPLDVGGADLLGTPATADFDADGVVESYADELNGLAGSVVTVQAAPDTAPAFVTAINGLVYARP